jgi:hypothetical protein
MSLQARIASFGSAAVLVIAGAVCAALLSSSAGQIVGLVLIGLGLILATALVFLEVGLSEDRQLAREEREREQSRRSTRPRTTPGRLRRPDLGRSRDHRRRLD